MDNDHVDISNENFHQYTDKTKLENSAKWKKRFMYIMQAGKKDSYVSILSQSNYVQLIREVQEFHLCPSKVSTYQAKRLAKLDILDGRLITKRISDSDDIRYFLKIDEVFDILEQVHIKTGHRGRDRIKKEVCLQYANITTDMINLFLSMCQTCRNRRINHKRKFLNEVDLKRLDVCCTFNNISTLATSSQVMDIDCEETIKQHNEELNEHDEDDTCTDTNANTSFEKLSFEQSSVNEVLATPSSNGVGDNCVDDDDEDDDDDDDDEEEDNGVAIRENGIDSIDDHEPNEAIDEDHDNTTDDDDDEEEEEEDVVVVDHQRNDLNLINTEDQKIIIDYDDDGNDGDNDDDDEDEDDDIEDDEDELLECNRVNEEKPEENPREINNQESSAMINITDNLSPKPVTDSKNIETVININTDESKNDTTINRNISENNQQLIVNNTKSDVSMTITTIDISSTSSSNDKKKSIVRKPSVEMTLPARRSLRNVNKRKADDEIEMLSPQSSKVSKTIINFSDDDVQVIDLDESKTSSNAISNNTNNKSTIFVNDTKHLARIAAKTGGMKKEPTLVIIDTKSSSNSTPPSHLISTSTISSHRGSSTGSSSISIINKKQPSLSLISSGASKASITPITTSNSKMKTNQYQQHSHDNTVLPSLTDDMFVVEAPSFIVPYVYEKPSTKSLKGFLNEYKKEIEANYVEKKKKKSNRTKQHKSDKDRVPKNTDNSKEKGDSSDENSSTTTITSSSENESEEFDSDEPLKQNSLIKKMDNKNTSSTTSTSAKTTTQMKKPQSESTSYFESPIGKFLIKIGFNLVREPVQEDLLRHQKRMKNKTPETEQNIASLMKNIALSKEQNQVFKQELKKCDHCTFKTESILVLLHHLRRPHMRNNMYLCSYCKEETSSVELIVKHTTIRHQIQPWLERLPSPFQCSLCPFEDFQRGKLSRHIISCGKRFRIEDNLAPPIDWEPPAKIPRVPRVKQTGLAGAASAYQLMAAQQNKMHHFSFHQQQHQSLQHHHQQSQQQQRHGIVPGALPLSSLHQRNRNNKILPSSGLTSNALHFSRLNSVGTSGSVIATKSILPKSLSLNTQSGHNNNKTLHHPSISITPLPRQGNVLSNSGRLNMSGGSISGGLNISSGGSDHNNSATTNTGSGKPTFVICEICDGYIKDLEMLRNHMQWIHKVKIHPKMIYNRPPLNCQKCQFRFFTDQGLERHLLGSHGLVTSSMQEAANKSKDGGRCPICGKVYQWKLLNHVDKEHKMPLKPAHLSYKCTVCTATFGMYKQFENHVYSSHSMVAKKLMDKKTPQSSSSTASSGNNNAATTSTTSHSNKSSDSFKPMMKFNDEITIIPQPAKK